MATPLVSKGSNVSDSTIQKHIRAISTLKEAAEGAHAEYRASLKAAKTAGINTKALIDAMAARKRETEDVTSDLRNYTRYLGLLGMPLTQMDLFGSQAEEEQRTSRDSAGDDSETAVWKAMDAGTVAGKAGEGQNANPYDASSAELEEAWHSGWVKGQATLAPTASGVKKADPRRSRSKPAAAATH